MNTKNIFLILLLVTVSSITNAQEENSLKLSGDILTDQRLLLKDDYNWAWNENRLSLKLDKQISGESKFYSEVWVRNIGLPGIVKSSDLYNKGIVDPYNLEIREAYVQVNGFLSKNIDMTIGRQQIVWGTADKLNPTNNLNPYDLEDILDFGRKRGSDAINLQYYISNDFSYDNMESVLFSVKYTPKLTKTETNVFVLELTPKGKSDYSKVIAHINKTNYYPEKMEYYDKAGNKIKEAKYTFKKIGNYWNAAEIEMTDLKKNHTTKMQMSDVKYDTGLTDDDFTVRKFKQ